MLTKQKYDGTLSEEIVTPLTHDPLHQALSFPFLSSEHFHMLHSPRASEHYFFEKSHTLQILIIGCCNILIVYNTLPILLLLVYFITKYCVFSTSLDKYILLFLCLCLPLLPPLPEGLEGMSGAGKDVSSLDVQIEWQAISVRGKATHYPDCFAVFLGSQGQCHLSPVGPLHGRTSLNGIYSLVWLYSSARGMCTLP